MTVSDEERLARVALSRVSEPGTRSVALALESMSAAEVWAAVRRGVAPGGFPALTLDRIAGRARGYDPRRDLDRLHTVGGRVLCPGDAEWPDRLTWPLDAMHSRDIKELAPPWALYVRGALELGPSVASSVSVVGARACSAYGQHVASELAYGLAEVGVAVVSGGAFGIDAAAHRAALAARNAPTIAVLACGVDIEYPRSHSALLAHIATEGLLVSEVPPGSSPTRVRFLVRNRVIAALSLGTVVVEAAFRSGSLSTAARAGDLNRVVMAVPGPVTSAMSGGCHELVRAGRASLVTKAQEVLDLVGAPGEVLLLPERGPADPRDSLSEDVRRVLDAVPVRTPAGLASIARTAGVSVLFAHQVLPSLQLADLVEPVSGGWRLTALGAGKGPSVG